MRPLLAVATAFLTCVLGGGAAAAATLTIYTYESFIAEWGPGPAIKSAFEAQCVCQIDWVALPDGLAPPNVQQLLHLTPGDNCPICRMRAQQQESPAGL